MSLTFAEAQYVVALAAGIKPERLDTFNSRMKQWQKMGFPEGTRVGRGVKAQYGAKQILQLVLLVKLLRIGLTPDRAQNVINTAWTRFMGGFVETLIYMANGEQALHYFTVQLDALSDLTTPGGSDHLHTFVDVFTDTEMLLAWDEPDDDWSEEEKEQQSYSSFLVKNRMAVSIMIEIDSLLVWMWTGLDVLGKGPDVFADEFAEWEKICRKIAFEYQESQPHFDEDLHNQSVALRAQNIDRMAYARASIPKDVSDGDDT